MVARPRLALPFTIMAEPGVVRLSAGEDFRYTLSGAGLERWLPGWLKSFDGCRSIDESLAVLPEDYRSAAITLVQRLYGERIIVDGTVAEAHRPAKFRLVPEGVAAWAENWHPDGDGEALPVLCQDRLDYAEALQANRRFLTAATPWLWASTGAMARAYVGPLFLPDAGPCLECLFNHFRRLSPAPELYTALANHAQMGQQIMPVVLPLPALEIVRQLICWKVGLASEMVSPALYRLHVLEVTTLEVHSHHIFADPECRECQAN